MELLCSIKSNPHINLNNVIVTISKVKQLRNVKRLSVFYTNVGYKNFGCT